MIVSAQARENKRKRNLKRRQERMADPVLAAQDRAYHRKYDRENRVSVRAQRRRAYRRHRDRSIANTRKWQAANPDKYKQHKIDYRARLRVDRALDKIMNGGTTR